MCINDFRTVDHEVLRVGVVAAAVIMVQRPGARVATRRAADSSSQRFHTTVPSLSWQMIIVYFASISKRRQKGCVSAPNTLMYNN